MSNTQTNWVFNLVDKVTGPVKDIVKGFSNMDNTFGTVTLGVKKDINELGKKLSGLKTKLDNTVLTDERMKIRAEIAKTERQIDGLSNELSDLRKKGKKSSKDLFNNFGRLALSFNEITQSIEGFADALAFGDEIGKLEQQVNQFVDGTPAQIKTITDEAYKLGQIYGDDSMQIVQAANAMTQNLGGTFEDNLKTIQEGYRKGANLNRNFIQQMREYPSVIGDMGVSADQMVAIIAQANKQGVWDDKAIDSIKEATIKLSDLNKEQLGILNKMGIDTKSLTEQIQAGDVITPIKTISKELENLDKASQMKAIGKLFGTMGEDAKNVILSFKDYEDSLDSMEDKTTDWQNTKEKFTGWMADMKLSVFSTTKEWLPFIQFSASGISTITQMAPALNGVSSLFKGFGKGIAGIGGKLIKTLVPALGAATTAQVGLNAAMTANPIGLIVAGIAAAIAAITALVVYWEDVVEWFKGLPGIFKLMLAPFIAILGPIIAVAFAIRKIIDNWDMLVAGIKNGWKHIRKWFIEGAAWLSGFRVFEFLLDGLDRLFPGLKAKLKEVWATIKERLIKPVRDALSSVFDWLFSSGETGPGGPREVKDDEIDSDTKKRDEIFTPETLSPGGFASGGDSGVNHAGGRTSGAKSVVMNLYITNKFDAGAKLDSMRRQVKQYVEDAIVDAGRDAAVVL